jgi:TldD protein
MPPAHTLLSLSLVRNSAAACLGALSLVSVGVLFSAGNTGAAPSPDTTLINLLKGELDREFAGLKAKGDPPPYYLAYEVVDEEIQASSASLGALLEATRNHSRGLDTTVRVGSPQLDNYHPYKGNRFRFTSFTPLSLDDDANQIRRALWSETDRVYRLSARRLLELKTDQQLLAEDRNKDADFSSETPERFSNAPEKYHIDTNAWSDRVRKWSAEFKSHPGILASSVNFSARREIRTFENTEGTAVQQGSNLFRVEVNAEALAPDGMDVRTFTSVESSDPTHMPADSVIQGQVKNTAVTLDELTKAPPAEPIVCPAILSGRASAVFFHEIFGHRVEGHRQKDNEEGQTFAKMLGQKVLPEFISVTFDPTRRAIDGRDLIGYYDYDDEGVKARPVTVVDSGVLKTFLLARSPVGQFTHSNAHGRRQAGFEIVARQSNLIVESSKQMSEADLRAMLITEVRRQVKPYGLYFKEVASGYTTTARQGLQAFTVVPLVVYRVFADGRPDELIRGVDIVGTPLASFQKILATSNRFEVFNGYCGAESGSVPVSAVSPAILVSEIETQKKRNAQQKLPILPRPGDKQVAVFE